MSSYSRKSTRTRSRGISRVAIVGIIASTAICVFALVFTWIATKPAFTVSDELDVGLRQVLKGEMELAKGIADTHTIEELESDVDKSKKELIDGIYAWEESKRLLDHQAMIAKGEEALSHLKKADELGFPPGYEGLGKYALGMVSKSLRQSEEALAPLRIAVVRYPQERSKALSAIVDILLQKKPPEVEEAEQLIQYWSEMPTLNENEKDLITIARSNLLLAMQKSKEAMNEVKTLQKDSPSYIQSRLMQAITLRELALKEEQNEREKDLREALQIVQEINESPIAQSSQRRESRLTTGRLLRDLGQLREALSEFSKIRLGFPETPEALLSGIEEMEIAIELGFPEQASEIASYFKQHLGKPELYISDKVSPADLRNRLIAVGKLLLERQFFPDAESYAKSLPELCTESDKLRILADAQRKIADQRLAELEANPDQLKTSMLKPIGKEMLAIRPYYHSAAQSYDKLAMLELRSPDYAELLWQAIECFQAANELERSNELLDLYMTLESRLKRPRALLAKGENFLAAGDSEKAIRTFRSLIDNFRDNPLAYRARILSAQSFGEQLRFDEAQEMLLDNLDDGDLAPENPMWRDSLFQLGNLLYRRGEIHNAEARKLAESKADTNQRIKQLEVCHNEYQKSIQRLEEALQRFGDDKRSLQTQYLLAEAYRKSAQLPQLILAENLATTDEKRQQRVQQQRELLQNALNAYSELKKKINSRSDALNLDPSLQAMLRNCYFGEADILFELRDYTGALVAYRSTANRYRFEPEALEALLRVSHCHEKMGNTKEAKQALLQALQILKGIPVEKDSRFLEVTPFNRSEWNQHLTWMSTTKGT